MHKQIVTTLAAQLDRDGETLPLADAAVLLDEQIDYDAYLDADAAEDFRRALRRGRVRTTLLG